MLQSVRGLKAQVETEIASRRKMELDMQAVQAKASLFDTVHR